MRGISVSKGDCAAMTRTRIGEFLAYKSNLRRNWLSGSSEELSRYSKKCVKADLVSGKAKSIGIDERGLCIVRDAI